MKPMKKYEENAAKEAWRVLSAIAKIRQTEKIYHGSAKEIKGKWRENRKQTIKISVSGDHFKPVRSKWIWWLHK